MEAETEQSLLVTRKFKRLLPWGNPESAAQRGFWVDQTEVVQLRAAKLNYNSKPDAFTFFLTPFSGQGSYPLIRLLVAEVQSQRGYEVLSPTGELIWVNPGHVFAIGSAPTDGTLIWMRPEVTGTFRLADDLAIPVLIGAGADPYHWDKDNRPEDVAKLLGIALE